MSTIDFEIDRFLGALSKNYAEIKIYKDWCYSYKSFRYKYPKWTMRNGNTISIDIMDNNHLNNTIALITRKDPESIWLKVLKQEKQYRELLIKIKELEQEIEEMEEIKEICL